MTEKIEDTNGIIRIRNSKKNSTHNTMDKRKMTKGQTMISKTLHRKLCVPEGYAVPVPHAAPIV